MFTGIIDHTGSVFDIQNTQLTIKSNFTDLVLGESIAVDGVCLTVNHIQDGTFICDISPETETKTTIKFFKKNQLVNLERALRLSDRLGGHFVTGHIDQIAKVKEITKTDSFIKMSFEGFTSLKWMIKKGSIAINGTSLTINEINDREIGVMLIPHTLAKTNLSHLQKNDYVNIEFDMMAKIIVERIEESAYV